MVFVLIFMPKSPFDEKSILSSKTNSSLEISIVAITPVDVISYFTLFPRYSNVFSKEYFTLFW